MRSAVWLLLLALPSPAFSQGTWSGLGGGSLSEAEEGARADSTLSPAERGSPRLLQQEARGTLVLPERSSDTWSLSGRAGRTELSFSPVVAETGLRVPAKLWSLQAGGAFVRRLGERRRWGANLGVGSASDEPFHGMREAEFRAAAFSEFPAWRKDSWRLMLSYSNNRSFLNNIPLPGAGYIFRDRVRGLQATVGFPFIAVSYRPDADWRFRGFVFGPNRVTADLARSLFSGLWAFGRYARRPDQWLRSGREHRYDRLTYDSQEARLGLRGSFRGGASWEVSGGREFERRFYESRDAHHSGVARADLADAWIASLRFSWHR